MAPKRRLSKRVREIGAQVEASIREDGEDHKFQAAASEQLFQIDAKGGVDVALTKKQKLLLMQKDPLVKSRKFKSDKASKFELEAIQKIKAQQEQQAPGIAPKKAATPVTLNAWGSDGTVPEPKELKELDEYVAPAVIKKTKRRKLTAPTVHKISKVQVAAPGQSYHPEFAAHQDVMAEAVAQELERQDIREEMAKPVAAGMSEETLQYIDTRGSDEESESEEEEESDSENPKKKKKMPGVVTKSQRNKRSRHKQMELEHSQRRQEKSIIKQINA
uniref:Ribosome biogenesis protein NOP53 n=1 Tax=Globisporangium ultimum (strain ATCC 200006 / CBS 805.95 / DAOM BR144) TaxID=431595 RepID=K3WKF7_GLOUD